MIARLEALSRGKFFLLLVAFFVAVRGAYHALGLDFDVETLGIFWQFLDPDLLEHDLGRSLFYLHSQPPLFNLFLGLVLRTLGPGAFHGIFAVVGCSVFLATVWIARRLGASRIAASIPAALWIASPSFALTEHWLMYDLPVAAVLLGAMVSWQRAAAEGRVGYLHLFFWALLVLCGMRSLFHPVFLWLTVGFALLSSSRDDGRFPWKILGAAVVPLLLLTAWQAKNYAVFGTAGTSSWLGMNLARIAGSALSDEDLRQLSPDLELLDTVPPFSPIAAYPPELRRPRGLPEVEVLTAERKSNGEANYHHGGYLEISRLYLQDALTIIRKRPGAYLHGMLKAWYNYLRPQSEIPHLKENRRRLGPYVDAFEDVLYGELPFGVPYGGGERKIYLFALLSIPGLWLFAAGTAFGSDDPARRSTLILMSGTVLFVALVGNSLEVWENQRFRFATDAFTVVFAALALAKISARRSSRRNVPTRSRL